MAHKIATYFHSRPTGLNLELLKEYFNHFLFTKSRTINWTRKNLFGCVKMSNEICLSLNEEILKCSLIVNLDIGAISGFATEKMRK